MGNLRSRIQNKLHNSYVNRSTINTHVWEIEQTSFFRKDTPLRSLPVVYKLPITDLYQESLKEILKSLEKFEGNEEIIKKLTKNFDYLGPVLSRADISSKGSLFEKIVRRDYTSTPTTQPLTNIQLSVKDHDSVKQKVETELNLAKKASLKQKAQKTFTNPLVETSDINFLKKEFVFTKLKYSRCPQYDSVSGGLAALFAGFIGFLISEKFGIELVDSGDFYFALMYALFIGFISHLLTRLISTDSSFSLPFSLNHNKQFLWEFVMFCFKKIKS